MSCFSKDSFDEQLNIVEKCFETFYTIENSEDFHKIVICCKNSKQQGKSLIAEFQRNNELFKISCDLYLIGRDYEKIIPKLFYKREKV